jgi:hypothetical protein
VEIITMGMFDYIRYEGKTYQTKDTSAQFMAEYEIRGDELWFNDVEHKWIEDSDKLFGGHLEPISSEWKRIKDFDGEIRFYDDKVDFLALFWEGKMIRIKQMEPIVYNNSDL